MATQHSAGVLRAAKAVARRLRLCPGGIPIETPILLDDIALIIEGATAASELLAICREYQLTRPDVRATAQWHTPWYSRLTSAIAKTK